MSEQEDEPGDAEIEAVLAAHDEWVAAGRPGAISHEEAVAELLRQDAKDNLIYWCRDEACPECREVADANPGVTVVCDRR